MVCKIVDGCCCCRTTTAPETAADDGRDMTIDDLSSGAWVALRAGRSPGARGSSAGQLPGCSVVIVVVVVAVVVLVVEVVVGDVGGNVLELLERMCVRECNVSLQSVKRYNNTHKPITAER
uniref:Uncharacterized protein n=1 Tax=Glossina austeni TaxID=7395 RepID=A0A1A9UWM3_GLOAU